MLSNLEAIEVHVFTDGGILHNKATIGTGLGGIGVTSKHPDTDERFRFDLSAHWSTPVTSQQMELQAVIAAFQQITAIRDRLGIANPVNVTVYSDSAYLVNCFLGQWWVKWIQNGWQGSGKKPVENRDRWTKIFGLTTSAPNLLRTTIGNEKRWGAVIRERADIDMLKEAAERPLNLRAMVKVKGHSGIPLNERADKLATDGKNGITFYDGN